VVQQGIWRIRTNQDLRELHKDLDTVANIKKKRLEWIGHQRRIRCERVVKKYLRVSWKEEEEGQDQD
jgi:hypothetical protein